MKQTPSAIVCLAAAMLAAGAAVGFSTGNQNAGATLAILAVPTGLVGLLSLINACMRDHDMAVDITGRLDFLQELVYLERLSLEHRDRQRVRKPYSDPIDTPTYSYEAAKKKSA